MITGIMLFGSASAVASGYPFAIIYSGGPEPSILLAKFASETGQFTQNEAQNLTAPLAAVIQTYLGNSPLFVITPDQLAAYDADILKDMIKFNYLSWGYTTFIFVNITKRPEYAAGYGPNIRQDIFVADKAALVNVMSDYLYVTSTEQPYMYLSR